MRRAYGDINSKSQYKCSLDHAKAIQQRRFDSGKRGYAKAARRLLQWEAECYRVNKAALPVRF